jgi:hypothetical protein
MGQRRKEGHVAALIVAGLVITAIGLFDYIALTRGVDSRPDFATGRMPSGIPNR